MHYDSDYSEAIALEDGTPVLLRTIQPRDKAMLAEAIKHLSVASRYARFFTDKPRLTDGELAYLTEFDGVRHWAFGALDPEEGVGYGIARLVERDAETAELAVVIADELHGRGLGGLLVRKLIDAVRERDFSRVCFEVLSTNKAMQRLLDRLDLKFEVTRDGSTMTYEAPLEDWSPASWRQRAAAQQPTYADPAALAAVCEEIRGLPPLVFSGEVDALKAQLAEAAEGKRFVLHGGDCAERFSDCNGDAVVGKLKILLQMSLVLTYGARRPVVRIGRIAGQYGKPRSKDTELVDGVERTTFRGDIVNGLAPEDRAPDPARLREAYFRSTATLNFVRALIDGGFADLHHPEKWELRFMGDSPEGLEYRRMAERIRDAVSYMESLGGLEESALRRIEFFTSHEGLLLPYEEAQTRQVVRKTGYYNLGAHFLWIGDRTRQLDGAHIEYFRGIRNPVGVKVGPTCAPEELVRLVDALGPEPGRVTLITRFGRDQVAKHLPPLVRAVKAAGLPVVWSCDPMHGNTHALGGRKTRAFDDILAEVDQVFAVHAAEGTHLGGVHFELTGDNVTECVGGAEGLGADDLGRRYETGCDPRLNYRQSLEMAFALARLLAPV